MKRKYIKMATSMLLFFFLLSLPVLAEENVISTANLSVFKSAFENHSLALQKRQTPDGLEGLRIVSVSDDGSMYFGSTNDSLVIVDAATGEMKSIWPDYDSSAPDTNGHAARTYELWLEHCLGIGF